MKLSEFWLREWINPAISSESLFEQMTLAGLEVNNVESIAGKFNNVVIGEIIESTKHPNIEYLWLTKVNIGTNKLLNIICKASNCRKGLKVAVAKNGALLPNNVKINTIKINGKISEGMLCSYSELGISHNHTGIIEFPFDAPISFDVRNYLQLDDYIFNVSLTPNRPDCLSILGIARDIAAINNLKLNSINIESVKDINFTSIFPIKVDSPISCPRFLGRIIKNINITAKTDNIIKEKLYRCGFNSINPVIDIINFVLLELGQPMNAYDFNCLNKSIIVRMAKKNELMVLPNEIEIILNSDTLVISDEKNILGISGIINSKYANITNNTTNIFLESAFFNPEFIIGKARYYGLHTESSYRFERGVDPELQYKAIERATKLIVEICGGDIGSIIDITNKISLPKIIKIILTRKKLDHLIGYIIPDNSITQILDNLGCKVSFKLNNWYVIIPTWRFDIYYEEDLIEEIVRIYGYNNIPDVSLHTNLISTNNNKYKSTISLERVKTLLMDRNYNEIITYSFVDPKIQQLLYPNFNAMILPDPISKEMSVMRLSLLPGLLTTLIYNKNRQQNKIQLFETGLKFIPDITAEYGVRQEFVLSGIITGNRYEDHWSQEKCNVDFFDIKGDVEAIITLTGKLDNCTYKPCFNSILHPGQNSKIYFNNDYIGYIGAIHPRLEKKLNLNSKIFIFELIWDIISKCIVPKINIVSKFPSNRRDIAIIVSEEVLASDVINECKKISINHIIDINLFDVYRGKGIAKGYKSFAISFIFQDMYRTLEEKEITIAINKYILVLKQQFQASLRS